MLPVAILAGGLATRLRPFTEKIPKSLLTVAGEPFLAHQLRLLRASGIERVVLCCGFLGEAIRDFAGEGERFGLQVVYSFDGPVLRGTAGALQKALPLLGDRFLTLYGDSYLPVDYAGIGRCFVESGQTALMTVYRNEGRGDVSNVEFEGSRILRYDKQNRTPAMRHIDYGLGAFQSSAFERVPSEGSFDLANLYQDLLADGRLAAYEVHQRFYEIGSFDGIKELTEYLSR
jgi:NDP-sugar pyrophosphorylase family protein